MESKILTLHPEGKKGSRIEKDKYDLIRHYILNCLESQPGISYKELDERANAELSKSFTGSISWYIVTVKLDLEARNYVERISGSKPQRLRLSSGSKRAGQNPLSKNEG